VGVSHTQGEAELHEEYQGSDAIHAFEERCTSNIGRGHQFQEPKAINSEAVGKSRSETERAVLKKSLRKKGFKAGCQETPPAHYRAIEDMDGGGGEKGFSKASFSAEREREKPVGKKGKGHQKNPRRQPRAATVLPWGGEGRDREKRTGEEKSKSRARQKKGAPKKYFRSRKVGGGGGGGGAIAWGGGQIFREGELLQVKRPLQKDVIIELSGPQMERDQVLNDIRRARESRPKKEKGGKVF